MDNNKKISDPQKIAEHLIILFCNIGRKLSDKIRPPKNGEIKPHNEQQKYFLRTNYLP